LTSCNSNVVNSSESATANNNTADYLANKNAADYIYVPSTVTVSSKQKSWYNTVIYDGYVYYFTLAETAQTPENSKNSEPANSTQEQRYYRASIKTGDSTELDAYIPPDKPEDCKDCDGIYQVTQFVSGGGDTALIVEYGNFSVDFANMSLRSDLAQFSKARIIKLTGEEVAQLNLESAGIANSYITYAAMDNDGNAVLIAGGSIGGAIPIYVFAPDGSLLFNVDLDEWISNLITLPDGRIGIVSAKLGEPKQYVKPIDVNTKTLGASLGALPHNARQIDGIGADGKILYHSDMGLFAFELGDAFGETVVDWLDAG